MSSVTFSILDFSWTKLPPWCKLNTSWIASDIASIALSCLAIVTTCAAAYYSLKAVPSAINLSSSAILSIVAVNSLSALARRS